LPIRKILHETARWPSLGDLDLSVSETNKKKFLVLVLVLVLLFEPLSVEHKHLCHAEVLFASDTTSRSVWMPCEVWASFLKDDSTVRIQLHHEDTL